MSHYQYLQIRIGAAAPTEEEAAALFAPERVRSCIQTIENLRKCLFRKWAGSANLVQQTFSLGCMFAQPIVDTFMAGIMFMQVVTYFTYQRNDKWWTKCIVIFASIISIIMTVYLWFFGQYLFVQVNNPT